MRYSHDGAGLVTGLTYPNGKAVTQAYDGAGQLSNLTDWLGRSFTFRYDHDGNEISQADPNGITAVSTFDRSDRITAITDLAHRGVLASFAYRRDRIGQVISSVSTRAAASLPQAYTYDATGQLTSDTIGRFSYDSAGNLTGMPAGASQTFNAAGELISSTASGSRFTRHGKTIFSYDANGNRTAIAAPAGPATALGYDQANRLTNYSTHATYSYNGDGLRMAKTVNGAKTAFAWDLEGSLPLLLSDSSASYVYGPDGLPLEEINQTGPIYLLHDQQGSTRLLTDLRGTVVGTYDYSPYGRMLVHKGLARVPLQFDGQYTDAESGFQYLRSRYYDPASGTFLTVDPLADLTAAPYSFAFNDPVNFGDPDGRCFVLCSVAGAVIGATVGAVVSTVNYAIVNHNDITPSGLISNFTGGAVGGGITGACDGTTFFIAAVGCGAVGGAAGEATTEFIEGGLNSNNFFEGGYNNLDPAAITAAGIEGGISGGISYGHSPLGEGEQYASSSDQYINQAGNDLYNGAASYLVTDQLTSRQAC